MAELTLFVAFVAGLVSFLSPCVLPILPGFLSYLAGVSLDDARSHRALVFFTSVFFVLGFSFVFALVGVLLNTLFERVAYDAQIWLARIGGTFIIFFGLYLTGLIRLPFLEKQHQFRVTHQFSSRYLTAFVFGAAFAAGWTPCVGAVLGGILGLAASEPGSAFGLLLVYALGLGIPFLLVGFFASRATSLLARLQGARWFHYVTIIFGIVLIVLGILAFTQQLGYIANLEILNRWLLR